MRAALILPVVLAVVSANGHDSPHIHRLKEDKRQGLLGSLIGDPTTSPAVSTTTTSRITTTTPDEPTSSVSSTTRTSGITTTTTSGSLSGSATSRSGSVSGSSSISGSSSVSGSANITTTTSASSTSALSTTVEISSDAAGQQITITRFVTGSSTPTSSSSSSSSVSSASAGDSNTNNQSTTISTGAIIGISVAVGAVVLGLIGCAIWRMKRRSNDEDDAIRWPELNRHGDSDAHHALPAKATGGYGIETSPLERSLSNSSEVYMSQHNSAPVSTTMALNGSNFGAASTLDTYSDSVHYNQYPTSTAGYYNYSAHGDQGQSQGGIASTGAGGYDQDDYTTSFPPALNHQNSPAQGGIGAGLYESDSEGEHRRNNEGAPYRL